MTARCGVRGGGLGVAGLGFGLRDAPLHEGARNDDERAHVGRDGGENAQLGAHERDEQVAHTLVETNARVGRSATARIHARK